MSIHLKIFDYTILTYYYIIIIIAPFIVTNNESFKSIFDSENFTNVPVIFDLEDCLKGTNGTFLYQAVDKIGMNKTNEMDCFKKKENIKTYECMLLCSRDGSCNGIIRKTIEDSKASTCWMLQCDSSSTIEMNNEYSTYFLKECSAVKDMYRYLPDLYISPFIFNPKEQCQQPVVKVHINACDYLSWHIQENTDLPISPYRTKTNFPTHLCINECLQDANCKAVIVEDVAPFGWTCHFYNQIQDKSSNKLTKTLYEKICCPMQPIDKAKDKLILYGPYVFFCRHHMLYSRNCINKFWLVQNNKKVKGQFTIFPLVSIQHCLLKCLDDTNCIAVNIDQYEYRCLIVTKVDMLVLSHTKYTLYTLTCCNDTDYNNKVSSVKISPLFNSISQKKAILNVEIKKIANNNRHNKNSSLTETSDFKLGIISIIGIVGVFVLLFICLLLFICCNISRKDKENEKNDDGVDQWQY